MRPGLPVIRFLAFLLLAPAVLAAQESGHLSVESLYHPTRNVAYVDPPAVEWHWRPDGSLLAERVERDDAGSLGRMAGPTWETRPLLNRAQFMAALAGAGLEDAQAAAAAWRRPFTWNPNRDAFLVAVGPDCYLVDLSARISARRLPGPPEARESMVFSPDGSQVAYLRDNDLHVTELSTGRELRLTTGGDEDHLNGRLDWLYQEEIFTGAGPRAFWWSPDSKRIAFLSLDESQVPRTTLPDERQPGKQISYPYPHPGQPNPAVRLGVADLDGRLAWMEDPFPSQETLIVQVGWDPKGRLLANYQDRTQTWLECLRFEGTKGQRLVRESSSGWTDRLPLPVFLADGGFLWRSARSGFQHLYRYDGDGRYRAPLTTGSWDVRAVHGVDEKAGRVYFSATQRNPIGLDAYSVDLDSQAPNQNLARLTDRPGTHQVAFNADFSACVDRFSDIETPTQLLLLNAEGRVLLQAASRTSPEFKALRRGRVAFQQVLTRDGFAMETMLVFPPGFDPARKYPVFQAVYGGPGAPLVRNAFQPELLWYQFLAQQGIVTWICDNRSASAKGAASAQGVYRNLGAQELRDQLDGLAWLKAQGWADLNRIALCGYSYGGFFTGYALTHSKAWKLGIMGAPVVDWRLYDSIYTERYLGLPQDNPDGYAAASPLKAAEQLSGKVLLIHGALDRNVHLQNTVQFLDALQKAGHTAPLILLPGSGHSPRAPQHAWAMHQSIWDFLRQNIWN
ncbi:MAG: DPP IV N-terminal domain-containing protein [Holophaga sp.]|nr:DPP IV N-terminal domain-containing protein [Holophaga sp.]